MVIKWREEAKLWISYLRIELYNMRLYIMIKVSNLEKNYSSSKSKTKALSNISFNLDKGDILAVLGPNGAGKSTLIKILATVLCKDSGEIIMDNCNVDDSDEYRKKFTVAMQDTSLDFWLSVEENLDIYGRYHGLKSDDLAKKIHEVLEKFELKDIRKKKAAELSGGYKKRLQLAKVFLVDTPIIMLDEPTAGLDPLFKNKVIEFIKDKAKEGKTIIYTTQIIQEAEYLCNKILILNKGQKITSGNIEELKKQFKFKERLEMKFNIVTESLYNKAKDICSECMIEKSSIIFNLSMSEQKDKKTIHELLDRLNPISISVIEPTLEEIFIDIVKEA